MNKLSGEGKREKDEGKKNEKGKGRRERREKNKIIK